MQLVDTINEMPPDPPIHRREEKKTIKMHWQRWTLCNGNGDGWCEGNPMATMAMAMEGTTVTAMATGGGNAVTVFQPFQTTYSILEYAVISTLQLGYEPF